MVFGDILTGVDGRRRRVVFYNAETRSDRCDRIIDSVGVHDIIIEYTTDDRFPEATIAIEDGTERLSVDSIDTVANYIQTCESVVPPLDEQPSLFGALDQTLFRSSTKRHLLVASRLIETQAATVGHGRLSAGFQQLSLAKPQLSVYADLPPDLTISIYGQPDWAPPADTGIEAFDPGVDSADYWWVIFDGTDQPSQHAALLAREQSRGEYTGFWTFQSSIIKAMRAVVDGFDARRVTATD